MAKISDEPFGDFKPKSATGPAGASRFELPSFTKGISPQLLIDNAKSQGIITAKQQADFKNRVGKDRTALAEFNEIVKKSKNPYGTPDNTAELPQEIYFINRKTLENRNIVQFELTSALDLQSVRAPRKKRSRIYG